MQCEPWPIDPTCLPDDWPEDQETVDRLLLIASEMLHAASGRTVGVCRYRVRPCRSGDSDLCQGICGCAPVCWVRIGQGQVQCVERIRINGETLPRSAWRLYSDGTVALAHGWCFPPCQDLSLDATEPGTWEITYLEGSPVTPLASRAVTALVAELARECARRCGVPSRRLQSGTVEGESFQYTGPDGQVSAAYLSIPEVDDWLQVVNPFRAERQAAVFVADHRRPYRDIGGMEI